MYGAFYSMIFFRSCILTLLFIKNGMYFSEKYLLKISIIVIIAIYIYIYIYISRLHSCGFEDRAVPCYVVALGSFPCKHYCLFPLCLIVCATQENVGRHNFARRVTKFNLFVYLSIYRS